jgi:hypothetical protein
MKKSGRVKLVLWTQTYPFSEEFEDTKGVMREGQKNNDQKDKQYNGQKKRAVDRRTDNTMVKRKRL